MAKQKGRVREEGEKRGKEREKKSAKKSLFEKFVWSLLCRANTTINL